MQRLYSAFRPKGVHFKLEFISNPSTPKILFYTPKLILVIFADPNYILVTSFSMIQLFAFIILLINCNNKVKSAYNIFEGQEDKKITKQEVESEFIYFIVDYLLFFTYGYQDLNHKFIQTCLLCYYCCIFSFFYILFYFLVLSRCRDSYFYYLWSKS